MTVAFFQHTWDLLLRLALAGMALVRKQGADASLRILLALMALDFAAAILAAWLNRSLKTRGGGLSSVAGMRGIVKKVLILLTVAASGLMDALMGNTEPMLRHAVTVFYAANEALSLVENLALSGLPVPKRLRDALEVLKKDDP